MDEDILEGSVPSNCGRTQVLLTILTYFPVQRKQQTARRFAGIKPVGIIFLTEFIREMIREVTL